MGSHLVRGREDEKLPLEKRPSAFVDRKVDLVPVENSLRQGRNVIFGIRQDLSATRSGHYRLFILFALCKQIL